MSSIQLPTNVTAENLEQSLQQAIELEIATIPTYLFGYYSIIRSWSQTGSEAGTANGLRQQLKADLQKAGHPQTDAQIQELSIDIQVYANKAAALIMTVVIEEMLHMALSSNVKQALYGPPQLYGKSPDPFPVDLPGHIPELPINLSKFSLIQLITYLRIESPLPYTLDGKPFDTKDVDFRTIGQFYDELAACVWENHPGTYTSCRPQLTPMKGYYAQNTINTVYYDADHNPQFPNADDSGTLIHVIDRDSAVAALNEVKEQGEGNSATLEDHLTADGLPNCANIDWNDPKPGDFDDPSKKELSHFDKFLMLYCQGTALQKKFGDLKLDFESYFVHDMPDNPKAVELYKGQLSIATSTDTPQQLEPISDLINCLYSYLYLMVETCYYKTDATQYEIFMLGVHKSMIWALSGACNAFAKMTFKLDGKVRSCAPTFEFWDFSKHPGTPKQQLLKCAELSGTDFAGWEKNYVEDFPDVSLDHVVKTAPLLTSP